LLIQKFPVALFHFWISSTGKSTKWNAQIEAGVPASLLSPACIVPARSGVIVKDELSASPGCDRLRFINSTQMRKGRAGAQSLSLLITRDWLRSRWGSLIGRSKEFLLKLHRDLIQPFFGAVGPILLIPGLSLKFPYLVFGCAELSRHFVSLFYGLQVFCLSSAGGSVKGAQNSLPGPVKRVAGFGPSVGFGCKGNYCLCHGCTAIAHCVALQYPKHWGKISAPSRP
jgi:hypothetical protein